MPRSARPGGYSQNFWEKPGFSDFASNALMDLGYGLTRGRNLNEGFQQATQRTAEMAPQRDAYATSQEEKSQREALLAKAVENLRTKYNRPDLADYAESGGADVLDEVWGALINPSASDNTPASVREWEHYNSLPDDQKAAYLRMKRATPYLNTGNEFVQPDPVNPGSTVGPGIAIDNYTPAYDAAEGAATAKVDVETQASFDSISSKMPGLKTVVDELGVLAEQATYTTAGKLWDDVVRETGNMPSEGALARAKYIAMVDNQVLPLLRDTFGAAFTVKEGETLRATLGDPNKHPEEKKAVLEAFIAQKMRDVAALQSRLPGGQQGAGGGTTSTGVPWSIEQ
jgi:hypothetical protein